MTEAVVIADGEDVFPGPTLADFEAARATIGSVIDDDAHGEFALTRRGDRVRRCG